jgi:hypothetical protein
MGVAAAADVAERAAMLRWWMMPNRRVAAMEASRSRSLSTTLGGEPVRFVDRRTCRSLTVEDVRVPAQPMGMAMMLTVPQPSWRKVAARVSYLCSFSACLAAQRRSAQKPTSTRKTVQAALSTVASVVWRSAGTPRM